MLETKHTHAHTHTHTHKVERGRRHVADHPRDAPARQRLEHLELQLRGHLPTEPEITYNAAIQPVDDLVVTSPAMEADVAGGAAAGEPPRLNRRARKRLTDQRVREEVAREIERITG